MRGARSYFEYSGDYDDISSDSIELDDSLLTEETEIDDDRQQTLRARVASRHIGESN